MLRFVILIPNLGVPGDPKKLSLAQARLWAGTKGQTELQGLRWAHLDVAHGLRSSIRCNKVSENLEKDADPNTITSLVHLGFSLQM